MLGLGSVPLVAARGRVGRGVVGPRRRRPAVVGGILVLDLTLVGAAPGGLIVVVAALAGLFVGAGLHLGVGPAFALGGRLGIGEPLAFGGLLDLAALGLGGRGLGLDDGQLCVG